MQAGSMRSVFDVIGDRTYEIPLFLIHTLNTNCDAKTES